MSGTQAQLPTDDDAPPRQDGMKTYIAMVATMFQGAFSDNVFRFIMTMLVLDVANELTATAEEGIRLGARYQLYIGLALALPWILAANVAGWMSNRYSKARVTQATKVMEIGVMGVGCIALGMGSVWFGILTFFLMMLQSAFFGPSKYGILPEILAKSKVTWGNGVMQGCTFFAIILGTIAGPWLYGEFKEVLWVTGLMLVGCAAVGMVTSLAMGPIPPANPGEKLDINPFAPLIRYGRQIVNNRGLAWTMFANVVFWSVGLMLQLAAIQILKNIMRLPDAQVGFGLVPIVVGNGVGCFLVGMLCRRNIKLWLVPIGGALIALTGLLTWMVTPLVGDIAANGGELPPHLVWGIPLAMGLVGLSCGAYVVPLQSYILGASPSEYRGGIWATGNLLTAVGWIVGSQAFDMIMNIRGNPGDVFLAGGVAVLVAALVAGWFFRDLFRRGVPRQLS